MILKMPPAFGDLLSRKVKMKKNIQSRSISLASETSRMLKEHRNCLSTLLVECALLVTTIKVH